MQADFDLGSATEQLVRQRAGEGGGRALAALQIDRLHARSGPLQRRRLGQSRQPSEHGAVAAAQPEVSTGILYRHEDPSALAGERRDGLGAQERLTAQRQRLVVIRDVSQPTEEDRSRWPLAEERRVESLHQLGVQPAPAQLVAQCDADTSVVVGDRHASHAREPCHRQARRVSVDLD